MRAFVVGNGMGWYVRVVSEGEVVGKGGVVGEVVGKGVGGT